MLHNATQALPRAADAVVRADCCCCFLLLLAVAVACCCLLLIAGAAVAGHAGAIDGLKAGGCQPQCRAEGPLANTRTRVIELAQCPNDIERAKLATLSL
eukprot:1381942-Alexandrium_andersonii.AAC.1